MPITLKTKQESPKNKHFRAKSNMEYLIAIKYPKIIKIFMLVRYSIEIQYQKYRQLN